LTNQAGLVPTTNVNVSLVTNWGGYAVSFTNSSSVLFYPFTSNSQSLDLANGTVRFWFQPNWSATNPSAPHFLPLLEASTSGNGSWDFGGEFLPPGSIFFHTRSNQFEQLYSFKDGAINGTPVNFDAFLWYQLVLTYSPSNAAFYANGVLVGTACWPPDENGETLYKVGYGNLFYPPASEVSGFSIGNNPTGGAPVMGQIADLETFNYPMTAEQVAAGFPTFMGAATSNVMKDSYYVGRSDMLQLDVDGVFPPAYANGVYYAVPCRLGYWRFDSPLLYAEQGQMALSVNNVSLAPSWSGTALVINSTASSQVTYSDVGTNGWANINCRQGTLRFWFEQNAAPSSYPAPFVYMGTTNGSDEWALELASSGTINFVTASNTGGANLNLTADCTFTNGHWTQIALTYGSNNSILYVNGAPVQTNLGVSYWPSLANRNLGMVIGNNMAHNASINGQFEEMETFNYQLSASEIASNFQVVAHVDADLNGIPDLLEDIQLPTNKPFLGMPVTITGTIEAEQFDMGSNGVGYYHSGANPTNSYRPTGMFINTCDDLGGGYCLDQTQAGDWAKYSINVLVPQYYMVEVRAEAIGASTGGIFQCEFTNSCGLQTVGGFGNITPQLNISTTNWANFSAVVYLTNGINVMTLRCLTNASGSSYVGRFNYISVYPYWTPPTNGPGSNYVDPANLMSGANYLSASNNAYYIQSSIDSLPTNGGIVQLPSGSWFISQVSPNETNAAWQNSGVYILANNIAIAGAGKTNTTLIAYNRATTVFCLGEDASSDRFPCANFILRDMTIEARPNWAVPITTNITYGAATNGVEFTTNYVFGTGIIYDANPFVMSGGIDDQNTNLLNGFETGGQVILSGPFPQYSYNILLTNCEFLNGFQQLNIWGAFVSNVFVQSCDFLWNSNTPFYGNVGFFAQANNLVVISNTFNGNTDLAPASFADISTNSAYDAVSAVGLLWVEAGGNFFVGRNTIQNYYFEGVHVNEGPDSIVGNTYSNFVSDGASCALDLGGFGTDPARDANCFIGNSVYGGRKGLKQDGAFIPYTFNCSGNTFTLYPPLDRASGADGQASLADMYGCQSGSVCGNTFLAGGIGLHYVGSNSNALVLNNNFAGATFGSIGRDYVGDFVNNAQIYGNTLSQGVTFHVQLPTTNSFGWFLKENIYMGAYSNSVPPFTDPLSSAVHVAN
jgi:hypothetical protein